MKKINLIKLSLIITTLFSSLLIGNQIKLADFNKYPISQNITGSTRGGSRSDSLAMTDGLGTILLSGISDGNNFDNSVFNNLLLDNADLMNDNNKSLGELVTDNIILIPTDAFSEINDGLFLEANININGTACDDSNSNTINTTWLNDVCQGGVIIGSACDDGNANTINDAYQTDGSCIGTIQSGVCDDGNINTVNDVYQTDGSCSGTIQSGVCDDSNPQTINDTYDINGICVGNNVEGQTCDDGDTTTANTIYHNGICQGGVVIGSACDDGNASTSNDVYNTSGICQGNIYNAILNANGSVNCITAAIGTYVKNANGDNLFVVGNKGTGTNSIENYIANHPTAPICTSHVTNMSYLFYNYSGTDYPSNISNWDTSHITNMKKVFYNTHYDSQFNQPLNNWNVSHVTNMSHMFSQSRFNQPLNNWNVSNVTNMFALFNSSPFNQNINNWNVSHVTDMRYMFCQSRFNQPLNNWNVKNVTDMYRMFQEASQFNQDISGWNVINVTDYTDFDTLTSIAGTSNEPAFY